MFTHIIKLNENPYEDLYNNNPILLRYYPVPDVYVAEGDSNFLKNEINKIKPTRVITTNEELYKLLIPSFKHHGKCYQYSNFINAKLDNRVRLLEPKDLNFVVENTGREMYINKLFQTNSLYGFYKENKLSGYGCYHVDGTIGLIFVKEEYRRQGVGSKIVLSLASNTKHPYCHVKDWNTPSQKMFRKIANKEEIIYWVYNEDY